jgi:hypothetical protein
MEKTERKEVTVRLRVTMEERWLWKQVAESEGVGLSEWMRGVMGREVAKWRRGKGGVTPL